MSLIACNSYVNITSRYGHSEGSPSEKGLQIDAQTGLDYLTSHPIFRNSKIVRD